MKNLNIFKSTTIFSFFFLCLFSAGNLFAQHGKGQFSKPKGIAVDKQGYVYILDDQQTGVIKKFNPDGSFNTKWGKKGEMGNEKPDELQEPEGIAVDSKGDVYVLDKMGWIQKFKSDGTFIGKIIKDLGTIFAITIKDDILYVTERDGTPLHKYKPDGQLIGKWGKDGRKDGEVREPLGMTVDKQNNVYIADTRNEGTRIQKFKLDGPFVTKWGPGGVKDKYYGTLYSPRMAVDKDGNIHVVVGNHIDVFNPDGKFLYQWGAKKKLSGIGGLTTDTQGNIYVVGSQGFQKVTDHNPNEQNVIVTENVNNILLNISAPTLPSPKTTYQLTFKHSNKAVQIDTGEGMEMEEGGDMGEDFGGSLGIGGEMEEGFEGEVEGDFEEGDFAMDALLLQEAADKNNELQYWTIKDAGSGYFQIISPSTTEVLELKGEGEEMYPSTGKISSSATQLWKLEDAGNDHFRLLNKAANKYLEVPDNDKAEGAILHYGPKSGDNQLVKFVKVQ